MGNGLLDLGLRCRGKSALTANLIGRSDRSSHAIAHHGFDLGVEGGAPGAQALPGGGIRQAEISVDDV
ncbi:MAG TPA: hypothetical protein VGV09_01740 [Steroidobacteraceae bacterium]|nr:hypothetical protein [Steroidobacteraceae bacterium]